MDRKELLKEFLGHWHVRKYPKDCILFDQHTGRNKFCVILSGSVEFYIDCFDQFFDMHDSSWFHRRKKMLFWRLHKDDTFGYEPLLGETVPDTFTYKTREITEVAEIGTEKLKSLLGKRSSSVNEMFLNMVASDYASRLHYILRRVNSAYTRRSYEKVGEAMLQLARYPDAKSHQKGVFIQVSVTEISELAGCCRRQAGSAIKRLVQDGFIEREGKSHSFVIFGKSLNKPGDTVLNYRFKIEDLIAA